MRSEEKTSVRDVAKHAGVSASTASRVLSGSDYPVSAALKEKILRAARELGYSKKPQNREIAAVIPTLTNPFYTSLTDRFCAELSRRGYKTAVYASCYAESPRALAEKLCGAGYAGILVASADTYESFSYLAGRGKCGAKLVFADCPSPLGGHASVSVDYRKGGVLAAEYLISRGHKDIVYAGMKLDRESRVLRRDGFCDALARFGIPSDGRVIIENDFFDKTAEAYQIKIGERLAGEILKRSPLPTAVAAVNDMVAFGLIRGFTEKGLSVPRDISVIGFDDNMFCLVCTPPLSTVKVQDEQIGRMAAKLLLDDIERAYSGGVNLRIEPSVVERSTVRRLSAIRSAETNLA